MIRNATINDAPSLALLCCQLGYPTSPEDVARRLGAFGESEPVFVYEVGGMVVGWMQVRESASLESGAGVELIGLITDKDHRGSGIGAALVATAKKWAIGRGHTRLRVRTNQVRTRTHVFYERLGFTLTKTQRVYDMPL